MLEKIDALEQYGRRNCLIIHGLPEADNDRENTDELACNFIQDNLKITVTTSDIDRSHRLNTRRKSSKPRPIIVKFLSYNKRNEIFRAKRRLKGIKGIAVTESLTTTRLQLLKQVKDHGNVKNAWTMDGRVLCTLHDDPDERKILVERAKNLCKLSTSSTPRYPRRVKSTQKP